MPIMEKRNLQINFCVSPSEKAVIYRNAGNAGLSATAYVRMIATQPQPTQQKHS